MIIKASKITSILNNANRNKYVKIFVKCYIITYIWSRSKYYIMKTHGREILIFYHADSAADRKTLANAMTMSKHIKAFDFAKASTSGMSWFNILEDLAIHPKDLLNKAHPYYKEHIKGKEFDDEGWIKVLAKNPDLIKFPIAIRGSRKLVCQNPSDILQLVPA